LFAIVPLRLIAFNSFWQRCFTKKRSSLNWRAIFAYGNSQKLSITFIPWVFGSTHYYFAM